MKKIFFAALLYFPLAGSAQSKINAFRIEQVKLLPGIFKDAQNTDLNYMLALEPDRLLSPFLREAGLEPKAPSYKNWENTGLDGHIGGHYLTAISLMYASTGDKQVLDRLNYMLSELKRCQDKNGNGYIGGVPGSKEFWPLVASKKVEVSNFGIGKKWVPLYNIHKTYAGLRDAWLLAHSEPAKNMLISFSDWMLAITKDLSDSDIQKLLQSEYGGLNEVFADVSQITGDKKYLDLAVKFSQLSLLKPLISHEDKLNGMHANTQIPKVIGFERIASLNGNTDYLSASRFFWETVVNKRTVAIGGNSVREHFHPSDNFSSMISSEEGPETCNTYNMLKLTKDLYQADGSEKYIDYYERALYNHILSSQHPDKGGFVYFTPMRPGHYRVYSQPQEGFWCCVGSGMENHAKYSELIYSYKDNDIYVNLFIPSMLNWKEKGIVLTQQTRFPDEETTILTLEKIKKSHFTLNVRYPVWVTAKSLIVTINGEAVSYNTLPGSYIALNRKWKKGDKISITLPMHTTTEQLPDGSDYVAVLHGPIVMAAKTDTLNMTGLFADDSRGGHIAHGEKYPLQTMPVFVSNDTDISSHIKPVSGKSFTYTAPDLIYPSKYTSLELIPFYKLHDSRYIIYWQKLTTDNLKTVLKKLDEDETTKQKIEALTIDAVTAGEQQPESDHFMESEQSSRGITNDRHSRSSKKWFSYKITDTNKKADQLQVTYHGGDKNRRFKIIINNQIIKEVQMAESRGDFFFTENYSIPAEILKDSKGILTVKFQALEGSETANVFEIRLLRKITSDNPK